MPRYRRNFVAGGCYFFTVNLLDRRSDLLVSRVHVLREAVRQARLRAPFEIDAWLPDHMHCVWTLPPGDVDFSGRWRAIKMAFSKQLPWVGHPSETMARRGERGVWQRRYWEHTIRDEQDYAAHVNYTHFNPVKHGYVPDAASCPYSSFRRCVAAGLHPPGWAGDEAALAETGERSRH